MPLAWTTSESNGKASTAMEAHPDTQAEVDFIILDYLACLAIDEVLAVGQGQIQDDGVDWRVDSVTGESNNERAITRESD